MLKELLASNIDLYVDQGDTYYKKFIIKDNSGVALNLAGLDFSAIVKRYYNTDTTYSMSVTVIDSATGQIALEMSSTESSDLVHDRYVYSVLATDGNDTSKILYGQILVQHL